MLIMPPYNLSLSLGIARFDPLATGTIDALLTPADAVMYEQKKGKNFAA